MGTKQYRNLTKDEWAAIKALKEDDTIVIKAADKGGATVIMNQTDYHAEVMRQLHDTKVYALLTTDPLPRLSSLISNLIEEALANNIIDHKTSTFLNNEQPSTPQFYILPKVHKSLIAPPGRPIVAGTNSIFQNLAIFLDKILQPAVMNIPSFLLDTGDFLNKISNLGPLPEGTRLCTMDVNSLYTAIPHELGIQCIRDTLDSMQLGDTFKTFLITLLTIILKENYFQYLDKFYIQLQGTAMGSNVAPSYANLFMANFEEKFVYPHPSFIRHALLWYRYIDDVFFMWSGTVEELLDFKSDLDNSLDTISFTLEHDLRTVHFLDVAISNTAGIIMTDIYKKPTDRNTYLSFQSYHPKPLREGLPYSQYIRLRRITNNDAKFEERANEMSHDFLARGYPQRVLTAAKTKAQAKTRDDLLRYKPKKQNQRLPMILTYSEHSTQIKNIIRKHWPILSCHSNPEPTFTQPPLFVHKKSQSLRNMLIRARAPDSKRTQVTGVTRWLGTSGPPAGMFPCGHCVHCNAVIKTTEVTHPSTGVKFPLKQFFNCNSSNVIYLLKCPCGMGYVGKTTRPLKTRFGEHRSAIRRADLTSPVARHFLKEGHQISQLRFMAIELVRKPKQGLSHDRLILQRELFWMYKLDTRAPKGLNEDCDLTPFL